MPLFFWAHSKTGLYFSLLNARLPVRPDNSSGLLVAHGASEMLSPRLTLGHLMAHTETGLFLVRSNFRPLNGP